LICLFGGTFDPVHVGHLHAARVVCDALNLTRIRMVLSARPGHRDEPGASVAERWRMLELACAADDRLLPDDIEIRRAERLGGRSYTVETLEALRADHPDVVLSWVLGSDAYAGLERWHRWRELFELANLVVLRRPGSEWTLPDELSTLTRERRIERAPDTAAGGVLILTAAMLNVSATRIRRALRAGEGDANGTVADLLPATVYTYITNHHLYGVVSDA
jgi:nicotinate-nucleotide adenylyltransferase